MNNTDIERFSDTAAFDDLEQPERHWPIVVETTTSYVIWTPGENYADALDTAKRDGDIYEAFTYENRRDSDWGVVDTPYPWQVEPDHPAIVGPVNRCAECERVEYIVGQQPHAGTCSRYHHYAGVLTRSHGDRAGQSRGNCSCLGSPEDAAVFPWRDSRELAHADALAHVDGREATVRP